MWFIYATKINPVEAIVSLLYPLETSENHIFFDVLGGVDKKRTLARNGLNNYDISGSSTNCVVNLGRY